MDQHQTPQTEPQEAQPQSENKPMGPMIGAVVVIILLLLGALYFWGSSLSSEPRPPALILPDENGEQAQETSLPQQSQSDETNAIEDDAGNTDIASFESQTEADLQTFESEVAN